MLLASLDDEETAAAPLLRQSGLNLQRLKADLTEWEDLRQRLLRRTADPSPSEPLLLDLTAKGDIQPVSFWQRERLRLKIALLKREQQGVLLHGDPELVKLLLGTIDFGFESRRFAGAPERASGLLGQLGSCDDLRDGP